MTLKGKSQIRPQIRSGQREAAFSYYTAHRLNQLFCDLKCANFSLSRNYTDFLLQCRMGFHVLTSVYVQPLLLFIILCFKREQTLKYLTVRHLVNSLLNLIYKKRRGPFSFFFKLEIISSKHDTQGAMISP